MAMLSIPSLTTLNPERFDAPTVLKRLANASRKLAELKGVAGSIPNQGILINALGLQEAKDSSEIENIVTTHDELFKGDVLPDTFANPAAKEVLRYRQALQLGFQREQETGLITVNHLIEIQGELERHNAGFRKLPGTALKSGSGTSWAMSAMRIFTARIWHRMAFQRSAAIICR
jgi:Fic family protein